MKKRASFIVVLPALALSCGVREEPKEKPASISAVVQTSNPPASIEAPTSAGAIVQPTSTPASNPLDYRTVNPPASRPEVILPTANPPAIIKPKPIHKNPPALKNNKEDDTANPF